MKSTLAVIALLAMTVAALGGAQEQKASTGASATTLKVQLVVSRYQGEKKISSLPYTLTVLTDDRNRAGKGNLRLGTQVPITTLSRQGSDANAPLVPTVMYRDVGTSIDCFVTSLDDGRFKLDVTVEDSSVDTATGSGATNTHPAFRSFRTNDSLLLRDGQSAQYSTATDKVNGDVWKVDVTLSVVK